MAFNIYILAFSAFVSNLLIHFRLFFFLTDIDECALDLARCAPNSQCVNTPGSYRCDCKPGYRSSDADDNDHGLRCFNVNECHEGRHDGEHACPAGALCRDTDGAYECICRDPRLCARSCTHNRLNYNHGARFTSPDDRCSSCECDVSNALFLAFCLISVYTHVIAIFCLATKYC